jgi:hypothetical protein
MDIVRRIAQEDSSSEESSYLMLDDNLLLILGARAFHRDLPIEDEEA